MTFARSACPYDCPDTCGLIVETDGKTVLKVKGDPEHPVTQGYVCRKMQRYDLSINSPDRLLRPLKRTGPKGAGKFAPISWEDALAEIYRNWQECLDRHGPQAILPFFSSGAMSSIAREGGASFFNRLGASTIVRTICAGGKSAGWEAIMGASGDLDPRELADSDCLIIWGSSLTSTRLHLLPIVQNARKLGRPVILVEAYRGETAKHCDETILLQPGSDAALVLSMLHVLKEENLLDYAFLNQYTLGWDKLEATLADFPPETAAGITGVPAATIHRLARLYGQAKAPAIVVGTGATRRRNGAMTARCLALLPAAVGAWGKAGGGMAGFGPNAVSPVNLKLVARPDFRAAPARAVNMNRLAAALGDASQEPPIKSLFVFGANPLAVGGNQAALMRELAREDLFTVVHERFLTDTARYADLLLPATFSVEQADIHTCYGHRTLQISRAAVPPPGECRSNWNLFRCLARVFGFDDPHFQRSEEEMVEHVLANSPELANLTSEDWDTLRSGRAISLPFADHLRFATPSGKIEIENPNCPEPLPKFIPPEIDRYPLRLINVPSAFTLNSTFNERKDLTAARGPLALRLHEDDARRRGIADGARIVCFNALAEVEYTARITSDGMLPGTVVAEGVYPLSLSHNGLATNALISERLSDLGEATTLNDNAVEVRLVP